MSRSLPPAEILRKGIDETFDGRTPVLVLRWSDADAPAERLWELPDGFSILGPAPRRFALQVRRYGPDGYGVKVLWDRTQLHWQAASRLDLLGSCLSPLLTAVGLDLWSLLEQPIPGDRMRHWAA